MLDITPATALVSEIVTNVRDDQLDAPTPCKESPVAGLLDHIGGLCVAFSAAAEKRRLPGAGPGTIDASRLDTDWRSRIPDRLARLANAWSDPAAWEGMTEAGGQQFPGEIAGVIALDEVMLHGWDVAVATGQGFAPEPALVEAAHRFVAGVVSENPNGTSGLFGPPVPVPDDAPLLDRYLALAGRDPSWRP